MILHASRCFNIDTVEWIELLIFVRKLVVADNDQLATLP